MYTAPQAPQAIGGVIDGAIELFKASFRGCWIAALVYSGGLAIIGAWMQMNVTSALAAAGRTTPAAILASYQSPTLFWGYLLMLLVGIAFNLMIIVTILDVARGREAGNALSRFGSVLPMLPGAVLAAIVMLLACAIGFIVLVIPGVYLIVRWILWTVALCDERRGAFAGLGTSWRLVGGNWWRTAIVLSVVGVITIVLALVFGFVGGLIGAMLGVDATTRLIVMQGVNALGQMLYVPAITATMVAIYLDLKLRKDGADLEARVGALGTSQA